MLFSDYGKGGLTHITTMIELARAAGKPVLVDPKGDDYSRYKGATVITPNRAELAEVVGRWPSEAQLAERAERLRAELGLDGAARHPLRGRHVAVRRRRPQPGFRPRRARCSTSPAPATP